jgi:hypothetical protein
MMSDMIVFLFCNFGCRERRVLALTRRDASDLGLAAVDKELGTNYEAGVVGSQKGDRLGDLVWVRDAADRHLSCHVVEKALLLGDVRASEAKQARRLHRAGADDVDADAAFLEVQCPTARQIAYCRLGGAVDAEV